VIAVRYNGVNSVDFDTFRRLRAFARYQTQQDAPDWIEVGGVDERIAAQVEKPKRQRGVESVTTKCDFRARVLDETDDVRRCPGDGEQHADKDHRLDDLRLNVIRLDLSGA